MSNRRRATRPMPIPRPGEAWVMVPAVVFDRTNPAAIEDGFQGSHDTLIELTGPLRRSGIHWTQHYPKDALAILNDPDLFGSHWPADSLQKLRDGLASPRALLIIAWAIAALPENAFIPVQEASPTHG